jgi:hypothetical protein
LGRAKFISSRRSSRNSVSLAVAMNAVLFLAVEEVM